MPKLRKGRDRCTATRRDGQPCQAPAIPGGLVCRRHGGAAPQVQIAATHNELLLAVYCAVRDWEDAQGTSRAFDRLCAVTAAQRDLREYEAKLGRLAKLRAAVAAKRAATRARGSTRRARYRAYVNRTETSIRREFEAAEARWRRDLIRWQAGRILTTSELLGIPVRRVTPADILVCRFAHGVPDAPQPVMRTDRRYGPRVPGRY